MMHVTHKLCPGMYQVGGHSEAGGRTVTITRRDDLKGWIAAADWDRFLYTDPVPTKRDAVREAESMLAADHEQFGVGA